MSPTPKPTSPNVNPYKIKSSTDVNPDTLETAVSPSAVSLNVAISGNSTNPMIMAIAPMMIRVPSKPMFFYSPQSSSIYVYIYKYILLSLKKATSILNMVII